MNHLLAFCYGVFMGLLMLALIAIVGPMMLAAIPVYIACRMVPRQR